MRRLGRRGFLASLGAGAATLAAAPGAPTPARTRG
ncbi:twin-arginine translocation signal domain-containing protein, partial [Halogeometricum sp. CBA1124]|nr:twin-arginine translocation signal domain-containing protein [Halogeometricum sp. CBA1124]